MKKAFAWLLTGLLLCAWTTGALANGWGLKGGILTIVSYSHDYDDYISDAESGNHDVQGRTVDLAVMSTRYHSQLLFAAQEEYKWRLEAVSTTAVYQPGDDRGEQVKLTPVGDSFILSYGDRERYIFVFEDGRYVLNEARFNADSDYGDSILRMEEGYSFWQSGQANSFQPIGEAMWDVGEITLQDFNVAQLPQSLGDVRRMNTVSSALLDAAGTLQPQEEWQPVKSGRKLAVYSAPDTDSFRASSGKAAVSTGGGMTLLGSYQGWTMVEYQVSMRTSRIGFVNSSLLSFDMELPLAEEPVALITARDTFLTDDPHVSQYPQISLSAGTPVEGLTLLNDFYALVSYRSGKTSAWGFVPLRDLDLPGDGTRWNVMDLLIGKWNHAGGTYQGVAQRILFADGTFSDSGIDTRNGQWRVIDCPADAAYAEPVFYEIIFTHADGVETRYGLLLHDDGSISLMDAQSGAWYVRNEYSTYGNG